MEVHERIYRELKSSGNQGWGGTSYESRMSGWEEQLEKLFNKINLNVKRVLEFGSGAGDISLRVAQRGFEVTGVEISPTAVEWANQKSKDMNIVAEFVCNSVADRSMLDGRKYDLIIDGNCLHCLFDKDREAFYDNLRRLIDKNGHVFISSAIAHNEGDKIPRISSIERCFVTRKSIVEELVERGFLLIEDWISSGTHEHYYGLFKYMND